jgi:hypothetical protein
MGDNYCCGSWWVDSWYESDLKMRIARQANGESWYGRSYFNSYSGYHCELEPEYYNNRFDPTKATSNFNNYYN